MTKAYKQTSSFLTKLADANREKRAIAPKAEPANALRSVFGMNTHDQQQGDDIEELLLEHAAPAETQPAQFRHDIEQLKTITAEIRSIQKQSALLIGERIGKAREILKKYRHGATTFTQWLSNTFSSRRTAYNCLAYYELYCALPGEKLKKQMQTMSHKAVYILASRTGSWEKKIDIVEKFSHLKQEEILPIIRKAFPLAKMEKRAPQVRLITETTSSLCAMLKRKVSLTHLERRQLLQLRTLIDRACAKNFT